MYNIVIWRASDFDLKLNSLEYYEDVYPWEMTGPVDVGSNRR